MLKLTYSMTYDQFQTVTVLGDAKGIFDLWFRLTHATPKYPTHGVGDIKVHNLEGHEVDRGYGTLSIRA